MDVAKLSRRTAVFLGIIGVTAQVPEALADTKAERKRKRRRVNLTCPQCPPAPNCTLNNGTTCTCTLPGEACVCDSCCPTPPACDSCCPQETCPDDLVCVDPKDVCGLDQVCADKTEVCGPEHVCCGGEGKVCTEDSKICEPPFKCVEETTT